MSCTGQASATTISGSQLDTATLEFRFGNPNEKLEKTRLCPSKFLGLYEESLENRTLQHLREPESEDQYSDISVFKTAVREGSIIENGTDSSGPRLVKVPSLLCSSYISFWKLSFPIYTIYLSHSTAFHIVQTVIFQHISLLENECRNCPLVSAVVRKKTLELVTQTLVCTY